MNRVDDATTQLLSIWMKFANVARKQCNILRVFTLSEGMICKYLIEREHDGLGNPQVKEISKDIGVTPSSMVRMLNSLEKKKVIERYQESGNHRSVFVRLTSEAESLYENERHKITYFANYAISHFGESKSKELIENMNELYQLLVQALKEAGSVC